jgi:serine/threonine protein kinase
MEGTRDAGGADWVGDVLDGRYRVDSLIGGGGMGVMYLASDLRQQGRRVAIKVPRQEVLAASTFRERFSREIGQLIAREHPHIVKLYDSGEHRGTPFAVLQYLPGGSLRDRLEEAGRVLTAREVMQWLPGIAAALDFIHREVLHRDVKPENILFDGEGHAYLADFGIAKVLSDPVLVTGPGTILGSLPYIAPEVATGRRLDAAYDQYALAVVVFEALSGAFPHEMDRGAALVQKAMQPPRSLSHLNPHVPPRTAEVVMRALSTDPRQRFESCSRFAAEFGDGIATSRRMWPTVGVAAAVSALAALLVWSVSPHTRTGDVAPEEGQQVARPSSGVADATDLGGTSSRAGQERSDPTADKPATGVDGVLSDSSRERLRVWAARDDRVASEPANPASASAEPVGADAASQASPPASPGSAGVSERQSGLADSGRQVATMAAMREFLQQGGLLHDRADYDGAIKAFDAALALEPGNSAAREGLDRARRAREAEARVLQRLSRPD